MPFEFPFNLIGILLNKGFSEQAIHETCSNPCSQVGAQNKDFAAGLIKKFSSVCGAD